jgi:hypothetical protein
MPSTIRTSLADGVAVVTLADPGRRNALSRQLSDELAAAVQRERSAPDDETTGPADITSPKVGSPARCSPSGAAPLSPRVRNSAGEGRWHLSGR